MVCTRLLFFDIKSAIGMFLFASLVMDNLLKQPTVGDMKKQLKENEFPSDLGEA